MNQLLTILIFTPAAAATLLLFIKASPKVFRIVAATVSLLQLAVLSVLISLYDVHSGIQLTERHAWIHLELGNLGKFSADYYIGLDGLSLAFVTLAVIVMAVTVVVSWTLSTKPKAYYILLLVLNTAIIGTFCSLDLLLFYVFFEFMLLPMYFLIGIWGGPRREYASVKFFLYTLVGSVMILFVIIGLYLSVGTQGIHTFDLTAMWNNDNFLPGSVFDPAQQWMIGPISARSLAFLFLLIGFGIKLPIVPLHTWLPDAHVEAPTSISVVLAALLLKVGVFGFLRIIYPVFTVEAGRFTWLTAGLAVLSIIYGALNALGSKDLKRLIAYSSISHMGFALLGIASLTVEGISGAVYQSFSHGLITAMLFILAGALQDRTGDRMIENYSGLAEPMKRYMFFTAVAFFAALGLPGFSGFIGELLIFVGAFGSRAANGLIPWWLAGSATIGLILGAAYFLWTIQRMFLGPFAIRIPNAAMNDLTVRELVALVPLAILIVWFGILPAQLLNIINPFAAHLVDSISNLIRR